MQLTNDGKLIVGYIQNVDLYLPAGKQLNTAKVVQQDPTREKLREELHKYVETLLDNVFATDDVSSVTVAIQTISWTKEELDLLNANKYVVGQLDLVRN